MCDNSARADERVPPHLRKNGPPRACHASWGLAQSRPELPRSAIARPQRGPGQPETWRRRATLCLGTSSKDCSPPALTLTHPPAPEPPQERANARQFPLPRRDCTTHVQDAARGARGALQCGVVPARSAVSCARCGLFNRTIPSMRTAPAGRLWPSFAAGGEARVGGLGGKYSRARGRRPHPSRRSDLGAGG